MVKSSYNFVNCIWHWGELCWNLWQQILLLLIEALILLIEGLILLVEALILIWHRLGWLRNVLVCGDDEEYLIGTTVCVPLKDSRSCNSSFHVEGLVVSVGFNHITFVRVLSLIDSHHIKPTARMLPGVSLDLSSVLLVVFVHTQTEVRRLHNKGQFSTVLVNAELLSGVSDVITHRYASLG